MPNGTPNLASEFKDPATINPASFLFIIIKCTTSQPNCTTYQHTPRVCLPKVHNFIFNSTLINPPVSSSYLSIQHLHNYFHKITITLRELHNFFLQWTKLYNATSNQVKHITTLEPRSKHHIVYQSQAKN